MFKIAKELLPMLFEGINKQHDLYVPVIEEEVTNFAPWDSFKRADLDTLKTANTPKSLFLPQVENLYSVTIGEKIHINAEPLQSRTFVVLGVRACDETALEILDSVYLSQPIDRFYETRRRNGYIITLACPNPAATCFCASFNIDAARPGGDVTTWVSSDTLYWLAQNEKGEKLTQSLACFFETADDVEVSALQESSRRKTANLPYNNLSLDKFRDESLLGFFDAPQWQSLHMACIACGTCTFLCPTCQCYDIRDFDAGSSICKYRCWDSCMYSDFTLMAHGNPRQSQLERFRQRFMHKLVYHPASKDGKFGCVGCGRCVSKCPVGLNIVKIIKELGAGSSV